MERDLVSFALFRNLHALEAHCILEGAPHVCWVIDLQQASPPKDSVSGTRKLQQT